MIPFEVHVCRIGYAQRIFKVEADNEEEAKRKALNEAGNYVFSEYNADYQIEDCIMKGIPYGQS